MITALITAIAAAAVALISVFLTYTTTKRLSRRSDQIAFVGRQLSELYGPLLALSWASSKSWVEFRKKYGSDRPYLFNNESGPSGSDVHAWRYWLKHVFMPINRRMYDIILTKADLIEGNEMPQCFIDFCAHVTGYEVTLAQWEDDDYSSLGSVVNHPGSSLNDHIKSKYDQLKLRQLALLGSLSESNRRKFISKHRSSRTGSRIEAPVTSSMSGNS